MSSFLAPQIIGIIFIVKQDGKTRIFNFKIYKYLKHINYRLPYGCDQHNIPLISG